MQRRHRQLRGDLFLGSELFREGEIRLGWKVVLKLSLIYCYIGKIVTQ